MKLYEQLPNAVTVGRRRVKLDLDFRNVLRMMDILQRDDLTVDAREYLAARCVCRRPVKGTLDAIKRLLFADQPKADGRRLTSFEQDAGAIRAAFRQVYGIDLWKDRLHWCAFTELLGNLPDGNRYMETIGIRARPMPAATKYNQKEREWLMKAKQSVALHLSEKEQTRKYETDVSNVFAGLMGMIQKAQAAEKEVSRTDGE